MTAGTSTTAKASIGELELLDTWYDEDSTMRVRIGDAIDAASGAQASSLLYLEVPAGHRAPWHTHTAEEIVYVLSGRAEARIGEERVVLEAGDAALIPAHAPHGLENVGDQPLRFLGFFASAAMVHVFDDVLQPIGTSIIVSPPTDRMPALSRP